MGLLQNLVSEALTNYFPALDPESLRLNVIRGKLDLKDVDLTPGHVFVCAGCPFRLTSGSIGVLGVRVPWTALYSAPVHVDARRIVMHFEQVAFPDSFRTVIQAVRDARRRKKMRVLAESERAQSAITRALQKFLPMLLDRVEINVTGLDLVLHFSTGEQICIRLAKFQTVSVEAPRSLLMSKVRPDLEKSISVEALSVTLTNSRSSLFTLDPIDASIVVSLSDGVCSLDLALSEPVLASVGLEIAPFVKSLQKQVSLWNSPFLLTRPTAIVADQPRQWFQYAVRAVREREGLTRSELSVETVRRAAHSFIEYRRLHVRRLQEKETLTDAELERITQLEDMFNEEMILLLRRRARAHVLAEQVSTFATKDWLSWALFDYRMSEEREQLSSDIRKALSVIETGQPELDGREVLGGQGSAGLDVSKGWTRARINIQVSSVTVSVCSHLDDRLTLHLERIALQSELDPSMEAYSVFFSVSDLVLSDGSFQVLHQGRLSSSTGVTFDRAESNVFQVSVLRAALDNNVSFTLRLVPCCFFLSTDRMVTYITTLEALKALFMEESPIPKEVRVKETASMDSASVGHGNNNEAVSAEILVEGISILVSRQPAHRPQVDDLESTLFSLSACTVKIENTLNNLQVHGRCHLHLECCNVRKVNNCNRSTDSIRNIWNIGMNNERFLSIGIDVELRQSAEQTFINVNTAEGMVSMGGILSMFNIFLPVRELFSRSDETISQKREGVVATKDERTSVPHPYHLNVSVLVLHLRPESMQNGSPCNIMFRAENMVGSWKPESFSLSVGNVEFEEGKYGGSINILGIGEQNLGIEITGSAEDADQVITVDLSIAKVVLCVIPDSIARIITTTSSILHLFNGHLIENARENEEKLSKEVTGSTRSSVWNLRISADVQEFKLDCVSGVNHVCLAGQGVSVSMSSLEENFDGSLCTLDLLDLSGLSGRYGNIMRQPTNSPAKRSDKKLLSFSVSPAMASVELCAVEIILFRPFIERLFGMVESFSTCINNVVGSAQSDTSHQENRTVASREVVMHGSDVTLSLPFSVASAEAIRLETSNIRLAELGDSSEISVQKLCILTQTVEDSAALVSQDDSSRHEKSTGWTVLLRDLNLNISRTSHADHNLGEGLRKTRQEWTIRLLNRAGIFVTTSQIRLLLRIPELFTSSIATGSFPSEEESSSRSQSSDAKGKSSSVTSSSSGHFVLRFVTRHIGVELLQEDQNRLVVSGLAYLELDPVRFLLRKAYEEGSEEVTEVTNWSLYSQSLKVEDKCVTAVRHLRNFIQFYSEKREHDATGEASNGEPLKPMLAIESTSRTYGDGKYRSSLEVSLHNLRIVPSASLHHRLLSFFAECTVQNVQHSTSQRADWKGTMTEEHGRVSSLPNHITSEKSTGKVPTSKISLKVENLCAQVYSKEPRLKESSVIIQVGSLKLSLLGNLTNLSLPGSTFRFRDVTISLFWAPSSETRNHTGSRLAEILREADNHGQLLTSQVSIIGDQHIISQSLSSNFIHDSLPKLGKRPVRQFFRPLQAVQMGEQVICARSGVFQLPGAGIDSVSWVVSSVTIQAPIRRLLRFVHLLTVLDGLPELDSSGTVQFPAVNASINSFSVRIQVPTSKKDIESKSLHGQANLRVRGTVTVSLSPNFSEASGSLRLTMDAFDETTGTRDQIVPLSVIEAQVASEKELSVSISSERLLRIVVSPLTMRVMTSLLLHLFVSPSKASKEVIQSQNIVSRSDDIGSSLSGLSLFVRLRGLAISGLAEEPRVQMLRLVLREIRLRAFVPFSTQVGELKCSVQDMLLEDTISWRFFGRDYTNENEVRWSNVISGYRAKSLSHPSQVFSTKLLQGPMHRLLGEGNEVTSHSSRFSELQTSGTSEAYEKPPLLLVTASWHMPLDHISGTMDFGGLALNLDMGIMPRFLEWFESVRAEIIDVCEAYKKRKSPKSSSVSSEKLNRQGYSIRVDHIVAEPVNLKVSVRAPPRRIRESLPRRVLMWVFGSESATNVTFQTPRFVFNGDFDNTDRFLDGLRAAYLNAMASRQTIRQLIWQFPYFAGFVRVFATSFLRSNHLSGMLGIRHGQNSSYFTAGNKTSNGLQWAMTTQMQLPSTYSRIQLISSAAWTSHTSSDSSTHMSNPNSNDESYMETVDITNEGGHSRVKSRDLDGKELLRWLRRSDDRIPLNESFHFFAPFSIDRSILITSNYLLFVSRARRKIEEPIICRSYISQYYLTGRRITIAWARPIRASIARTVARQQLRDTSSLARRVTEKMEISEIQMHEIECASPEYASWLHSQLPSPNAVIHELLG